MKYNKKLIGLIAGLVCLVLCLIALLATCGGGNEAAPTEPSASEQATQAPSEGTEAPTEEATEPTEETTEPTEEATEPTTGGSSGGSSRPGGTGGFTGGGAGSGTIGGDTDSSGGTGSGTTKEELKVDDPGTQGNPYAEVFGEELGSFTTVNLPAGQAIYYNVYAVNGSVLTIEAADAYVIYNGTTYKAQNGMVKLNLAKDEAGAPISLQIGTDAAQPTAYSVNFEWPYGSEERPYEVKVDTLPAEVTTDLIEAGAGLYYHVYGINGTVIRIEDADASVVYNGVTYTAENGIVTIPVAEGGADTPAVLYVSSAAAKQLTMKIDYEQGTVNRPYALQMGEFVTDAAAGKQVHYQYTAEAAGVVTLQYVGGADNGGVDYLLYNAATGDCRTMSADAVTDANGVKTVSVQMNQGDVLTLTITAESAAQITSLASYTAGGTVTDEAARATYIVKALDNEAAPVSNVSVSVKVGASSLALVTNDAGIASVNLAAGTYSFTLSQPDGYTASETAFELTAEAPERTIVMTKNEPTVPDGSKVEYTVTVVDYNGAAQPNVVVQFLKDGAVVALQTTDAAGNAKAALDQGNYTVALAFSAAGNYYDESLAVLTAETTSVRIPVAKGISGEIEELYVGNAYRLSLGGTYVEGMQSNVTNYFIFTPTQSGLYRFTTSNPAAVISYWGASVHVINDITETTDYADNVFTLNTKENNLGSEYIIGVTGASECVIEITRIGDAVLDETDIPPEIYKAKTTPKAFTLTLNPGQSLVHVDVTAATENYQLFLGADGYYHIGSETGPVMYVDLGPNAPYVSFYKMLGYTGHGGTSFSKTFRDESGNYIRREDYTACMCQYVECVDEEGYGVYPLTEDLYYMLRNGGEHYGWWDSTHPNYLFTETEGLNTEIAWMFCCCYIQ